MAKCKYCGAEVAIGARCTYCGSKAESWYYSGEEKKQEPKKKKALHDRVRDLFNGKIYIVKKGDCLWNIAKNLYGSGAEYYRLVKLNNIQDPNHIEVGWNSWSWVNRPLGYSDYPIGYGNYWEYPWRRCW